ncbi:MAG: hypothetical protein AUI50_02195 [Crenarchaeota archaeon 13_1_40CM_2_52_14]|nr:MAG: hypothetical protein AUI97_01455 [Crenarchaeota archaeon 13_1_40CM_3_52_17]OLD35417.1 MAG: hypothetical protein AUI50_02195 [Crenarchaeota archaeon 13_1_40CM_2_52_14]OLE69034.1 MAG: hypothetical protein AUF78_13070 [archaeon 13_1_20CM_2_51_12]
MLLGNITAIIVTTAAFLQALSWPIAGVLILVSLVFPLLAGISPPRGSMTSHPTSKIPATTRHSQIETKSPQHRPPEKHTTPNHQSSTKIDQRPSPKPEPVRSLGLKAGPKLTASTITAPESGVPNVAPTPRPPAIRQGPDFNPTIAKGDYVDYEVELDAGNDFSGEVTASGLVNIYLLDEDNLDNLDQGEEFWSETGEEGVENAKLEYTPPSKGKWFFVVENADDRVLSATVKIQKGTASTGPA